MQQKSFAQVLLETRQDVLKIRHDINEPMITPDGYENDRVVIRESKNVCIGPWFRERVLSDPDRYRNPTEEEYRILAENEYKILIEEQEEQQQFPKWSGTTPVVLPHAQEDQDNSFIRMQYGWTVTYNGGKAEFPDTKKIRYIVHLLMEPSKDINAIDLYTIVTGTDPDKPGQQTDGHYPEDALFENMSVDQLEKKGMSISKMDSEDFLPDTLEKIQEGIWDLRNNLQHAKRSKDSAAIVIAENKFNEVRKICRDNYGIKTNQDGKIIGLLRKSNENTEKARKAVSKQIKFAIHDISKKLPDLAEHLDKYISKGKIFCYNQKRECTIKWYISF